MQHNTNNSNYTSREFRAFYELDKFCPFMRVLGDLSLFFRPDIIERATKHNLGFEEDYLYYMSTREILIRLADAIVKEATAMSREERKKHSWYYNYADMRLTTTGDLREMYERKYINEEDLEYLGLDLTDLYEC